MASIECLLFIPCLDVLTICLNCPNLVELNISYNMEVTDQSIEAIVNNLPNLEILSISGCCEITLLKLKLVHTHHKSLKCTIFLIQVNIFCRQLRSLKSFRTLNVYSTFKLDRLEILADMLMGIQLNKSFISTIARPCIDNGDNRIWGIKLNKW